jgi:hypothetical protein
MGDQDDGRRPPGAALAWAGHPGTLLGLLLLVVNDHLLKREWPGPVTGKLSDVAGMLVAPPLLAVALALTRRRSSDRQAAVALALTGAGFLLAKTSAAGARTASQLWSLTGVPTRILADPTDLLALPVLAVAWLLWRTARQRPAILPGGRRTRALLAVPLLVAATVATAPGRMATQQTYVVASGDRLLMVVQPAYQGGDRRAAHPTSAPRGPFATLVSTDQGRHWASTPAPGVPAVTSPLRVLHSLCVPGDPRHCFSIGRASVPDVRESHDGGRSWVTAWTLTPGRLLYRTRADASAGTVVSVSGEGDDPLSGNSIALQTVPGGFVVVVDDQHDGLLRRDADGHWTRLGVPVGDGPATGPVPLTGFGRQIGLEILLALGWAGVCLVVGRHALRMWRDGYGGLLSVLVRAAVGAAGIVALEEAWYRQPYGPGRLLFGLALLTVGIGLLGVVDRPRPPTGADQGWVLLTLGAVGCGGLALAPFLGWTVAAPDSFATAARLSLLAMPLGVLAVIALARVAARRPLAADRLP